MSPLDRLTELIARTEGGGEVTATEFGMLLDIRSYTEDLLPLLREWAAAEMERQGGRDRAGEGESIARRCYDADCALLAALRGSP